MLNLSYAHVHFSGVTSQSYLNYWPQKRDDNVYVGAWVNPYKDSYCETQIAHLWICNKELDVADSVVQEHVSMFNGS